MLLRPVTWGNGDQEVARQIRVGEDRLGLKNFMALAFTGQIVLGAVAGELLRVILDVNNKAFRCKAYVQQLKSTLECVIPLVNEVKQLDGLLTERRRSDIDALLFQLHSGKELVRKCSNTPLWNIYKNYRYAKKIIKLNAALLRFFQMGLQAEMWFDTKQILVDVKDACRKLDGMGDRRDASSIPGVCEGWCAVPQMPTLTVALDLPLKHLKLQLFRDDVSVLGLCAPGGCGKTTLAAMLCRDDQVRGIFRENIFFLTISSSPNLKVTLQRLFQQMVHNSNLPEFQNDEDAVNALGFVLTQREPEPLLLVLDDVWSESVLEKFMSRIFGYKILVTSRTVFQTFDATYSLKMLSDTDAMTLFRHSAFPNEANYERTHDDLVNKIVKSCKGFPLAIKVIGRSLHQQPRRKWQHTERQLSKVGSIFNSDRDLLDRLATSLQFLDDTVRQCFLDLGSFPANERIPASALVDIWVECYGLDEDDAYVNLLELSSRNLINLVESTRKDAGEIDGNFNELFVVQHDLLRDLAIHQSLQQQDLNLNKRLIMDKREDGIPCIWREQAFQPLNARLVSIHSGEMLPSSWCEMQLPEVEVLILNFSARNYTLPSFMQSMWKLKVLMISNYDSQHAKLSDFLAFGSFSYLKRIRLEKIVVPSLGEIAAPLKNLHKISLVMCEVGQAFRNCYPTMFPNLKGVDIDYCNDLAELPPEICGITHLQKLSITNCHNLSALPQGIGNMTNLEVLRLHACTGLLELPNSIGRLRKLRLLDLSDCLNLKKLPEGMGELCGLRKLDMRQCWRVSELPRSTMGLEHLKDVICDEETASLWETLQIHLSNLIVMVPNDNINLDWLGVDLRNQRFH